MTNELDKECVCGSLIRTFEFQGVIGWMHIDTRDDRCYPDGAPEEQECRATPNDYAEAVR